MANIDIQAAQDFFNKQWHAIQNCEWQVTQQGVAQFLKYLQQGVNPNAFMVSAFFDDPLLQKKSVAHLTPLQLAPLLKNQIKPKIRIGYLSPDIAMHATSYLFCKTIQTHNKEKFEIYLYDYTVNPTASELRDRITQSVDVHRMVNDLSDETIANTIKNDSIDILVDLKGQVVGGRFQILRYQPAPIIVNYLGYPGCCGPSYHYQITDKYTLSHQTHLFEKVSLLNQFYLPYSDHLQKPTPAQIQEFKSKNGLNEDIVLGCINFPYKITQDLIKIWVDVLRKNPTAKFVALSLSDATKTALQNAFQPVLSQVVILDRAGQEEHLTRIAALDLYCDTSPIGAHTVALEAAYLGVPMLTVMGNSHIARVSASVNQWMGLTELVTPNLKQYKKQLMDLLLQPQKLADLKQKVNHNSCKVLNSSLAPSLEQLYMEMYKKAL